MQGQSAATEAKLRGISQLLAINMNIIRGRLPWARYFHFDLHAGCGFNYDVKVIGSPLAFLAAAAEAGIQEYIACFSELDKSRAIELARRPEVAGNRSAFVLPGHNAELCEMIPDIIRQFGDDPAHAVGSILIDPNKPTNDTPWQELRKVFLQCPKLDVIVNFPSVGMKRIGKGHEQFILIDHLPGMFNKKHWLIRNPQGPWQWCLCVGRNIKTNDYKSAGFVHWDSGQGEDIRINVTHTNNELRSMNQLALQL